MPIKQFAGSLCIKDLIGYGGLAKLNNLWTRRKPRERIVNRGTPDLIKLDNLRPAGW